MPQGKLTLKQRVLPGAKTPDINAPVPEGGYHRVSENIEDRRGEIDPTTQAGYPYGAGYARDLGWSGYEPDLNVPVPKAGASDWDRDQDFNSDIDRSLSDMALRHPIHYPSNTRYLRRKRPANFPAPNTHSTGGRAL